MTAKISSSYRVFYTLGITRPADHIKQTFLVLHKMYIQQKYLQNRPYYGELSMVLMECLMLQGVLSRLVQFL